MTDAKQKKRVCMVSLILLVLLAAGILADIYAGYSRLSLQDFWEIILGGGDPGLRYTLIQLRLPRIFTSLLVGVGLGLAGGIIQGVAKNDMAEPGILGINAGAGLALAVFIVFFAGSSQNMTPLLPVIAFAGSVIVAIIDYRLAFTGNGLSPKRLLLIGIAVSTAVSSVTTMLMLRMSDSEYAFVQNWLAGSIWGASWSNVHILFVCLLVLGLLAFYKSRTLNVLVLGNQTATGLGVEVSKQSAILLGIAIGMSSLCCAVGGGLSFVGLVCPHLARRLTGPNYRSLIGITALLGAVLLVFSDTISRTLLIPNEIPIGIVAAVIGAPYFLYLLIMQD